MSRLNRVSLAVGLLVLSACSSSGQGASTGAQSSTRNVLAREELMATKEPDLRRAIERLRPQWLRARGAARVGTVLQVAVFVDDVRAGGVEYLSSLRLEGIQEVRFYTAAEGTTRWGGDVAGGVIAVTRRH
jgi:hypothetical protein